MQSNSNSKTDTVSSIDPNMTPAAHSQATGASSPITTSSPRAPDSESGPTDTLPATNQPTLTADQIDTTPSTSGTQSPSIPATTVPPLRADPGSPSMTSGTTKTGSFESGSDTHTKSAPGSNPPGADATATQTVATGSGATSSSSSDTTTSVAGTSTQSQSPDVTVTGTATLANSNGNSSPNQVVLRVPCTNCQVRSVNSAYIGKWGGLGPFWRNFPFYSPDGYRQDVFTVEVKKDGVAPNQAEMEVKATVSVLSCVGMD